MLGIHRDQARCAVDISPFLQNVLHVLDHEIDMLPETCVMLKHHVLHHFSIHMSSNTMSDSVSIYSHNNYCAKPFICVFVVHFPLCIAHTLAF